MSYILTDGGATLIAYPYTIGMLRRDNTNVSFPPSPTNEQLAEWNVFPVIGTTPDGYDPLTQSRIEGTPEYIEGEWLQTWTVSDLSPEEATGVYDSFVTAAQIESGNLLDQADQYVVTALVRDQGLSPEFAAYRQALVDYQNLPGYPAAVEWPTLPTDIVVDGGVAPVASLGNEKVWDTPNETRWKIVDVYGAKKLSYSPASELSNNSYNYLGSSPSNTSTFPTQAATSETDVYFVNVPMDALSWLDGVDVTGQEIIVNGQIAVISGGYGYGPNGPIAINIDRAISYTAGDAVLLSGVSYQPTNNVQIPIDGSIQLSTIVPYKSQIEFNGEVRTVTSVFENDLGLGPAYYIQFDGQGFVFNAGNSVNLSLWNPEVVEKWLDPEVDFGISPEELRGYSLDYHLYSEDTGTIIGKFIVAIDDNPRVSHIFSASGGSDLTAIDLETYSDDWGDDKAFVFKRTDNSEDTIMIQWSGKAFYSPEWYD